RAVLRAGGDAVDAEAYPRMVVAEREPGTRGLDEKLQSDFALEVLVRCRILVAHDRVGDVGADVEAGRAGRPVAGAFVAADRAPREGGPFGPQLACALAGQVESGVTPAERVGRGARCRVGEHREDVPLRIPERMAVVTGAGETLPGNGALLCAGAGLESVEESETNSLLELRIALELDVGGSPEVVEVRKLTFQQTVPTGVPGLGQRGHHLIAHGGRRALARPSVPEELDHSQALTHCELRRDGDAADVRPALRSCLRAVRTVDHMIHACRHQQLAAIARMNQYNALVTVEKRLGAKRRLEHGGSARVFLWGQSGLVRDQLRLDDQAKWFIERFDLVQNRSGRALDEGDEPRRADSDDSAGRRSPLDPTAKHAGAEIEPALVRQEVPVADLEGFVVDE